MTIHCFAMTIHCFALTIHCFALKTYDFAFEGVLEEAKFYGLSKVVEELEELIKVRLIKFHF